jgi:hypothetical protein
VIPIVTVAAPVAFASNGGSRAGADDRADRSTSAASDRTTDNGAGRAAEQRTAKGVVLGRRLVSRHHDGERQQCRNSRISDHFCDSPYVETVSGLFALGPAEVNDLA